MFIAFSLAPSFTSQLCMPGLKYVVYLFTYYWSVSQDKVLLMENIGKLAKGKGKSHVWWRVSLPAKDKK